MGFLAALVELNIFKEITVEFLMVGHTGNQCDQLFSILTEEFKSEIQTVEDLIAKIERAPISPKPKVHRLFHTWDWKSFVEPLFTNTLLQNHSGYNAFQIKSEQNLVKLRAKKYPQYVGWYPEEGIKLLKDDIDYNTPVAVAEFREHELNLDKVLHDLRKYYFPLMELKDQRRVPDSWERLCSTLTQLPKKKLPPMNILDLPKQQPNLPASVPSTMEQYDDHSEPPDLLGERHDPAVVESNFQHEVAVGMDVAILTLSKQKRPWVGRVLEILSDENFVLQWYQRRSRSRTFFALKNRDGSSYTSVCSFDSVMFWELSCNKTVDSFELSEYWLKRLSHEYECHDQCYV